jgi:hypothetical protein
LYDVCGKGTYLIDSFWPFHMVLFQTCSKAQSWEDEVSTTSSVGAEEKTIKAVCEQIKVRCRRNCGLVSEYMNAVMENKYC